jgi:hypothetical protein
MFVEAGCHFEKTIEKHLNIPNGKPTFIYTILLLSNPCLFQDGYKPISWKPQAATTTSLTKCKRMVFGLSSGLK